MEEIHGFLDSPVDGENINKMCKLNGWVFSEKLSFDFNLIVK